MLLDHFLDSAALEFGKRRPTPPKELAVLLANYGFPGNVRELRSMVYDAVGSHHGKILSMEAFKRAISELQVVQETLRGVNPFDHLDQLPTLGESHELLVQEALRRSEGNQSLAARMRISAPAQP